MCKLWCKAQPPQLQKSCLYALKVYVTLKFEVFKLFRLCDFEETCEVVRSRESLKKMDGKREK